MSPGSQTPEHMLSDEKTLSWFDWISKAASLGTETSERAAGGRRRTSPGALADSGTSKAKSPPAFVRTRKASQGRVEDLSPGTRSRISQISSKWARPRGDQASPLTCPSSFAGHRMAANYMLLEQSG